MRSIWKLTLCILLCLGIGIISSIFTLGSMTTWYPTLNQPEGNLPNWVFAPMWATSYVLMGVSLWLASNASAPKEAYALFFIQLLLNLISAFFFFGLHSVFLGLIVILLMDVAVGATIVAFWNVSKLSALFLLPNLLWILYITYLNFALFLLNRSSPNF